LLASSLATAALHGQSPTLRDSIEAGESYVMVITENGELWTWGTESSGALGLGSTTTTLNPTRVIDDHAWVDVAVGANHTLAIADDGTLWGWGSNDEFQLGDGSTASHDTPVRISAANNWVDVEAGDGYSLAITNTGELYGWGSNSNGQLLQSTTDVTNIRYPYSLKSSLQSDVGVAAVQRVATGDSHVLAVDSQGRLLGWGNNYLGQLGIPSLPKQRIIHAQVIDGTRSWRAVEAASMQSYAIDTSGSVYAFGIDVLGNLGLGGQTEAATPTRIAFPTTVDVTSLAVGANHVLAVTASGDLYGWGSNMTPQGQLGIPVFDDNGIPVESNLQFSTPQNLKQKARSTTDISGVSFTEVAAGTDFSMARSGFNTLLGAGQNADNQLGIGNLFTVRNMFVRVPLGVPDLSLSRGSPA